MKSEDAEAECCEGHEDGWAKGYAQGFRDGVAAPGHHTAGARTAGFLAGIAAGRETMARAFWRAVCEEKATRIESEIAATKIDWFGEGEREGYLAEAAQLRRWAAAP